MTKECFFSAPPKILHNLLTDWSVKNRYARLCVFGFGKGILDAFAANFCIPK